MFESPKNREEILSRDHYRIGKVLVPKKAAQLLEHSSHQRVLAQIKQLAQLPDEAFTNTYKNLIYRFAEWVQLLPETHRGEFGSLLNNGLSRGLFVLQELHKRTREQLRMISGEVEINVLLAYAVFSATLLREIAQGVSSYRVIICDEEGFFVRDWNSWMGTLLDQEAHFYRVYPIEGIYDRVDYALTLLLARQIMPAEGFFWLTQDTTLYIEWLEALKNELQIEGKIIDILKVSLQVEKEEPHLLEFLPVPEVESIDTPQTQHGEAFYRWLRQELAKGNLNVNSGNAFVHRVEQGVFIEYPGLAKEFSKIYSAQVQMNVVFMQFGNLFGIIKKSGQDYTFDKYFSSYPEVAGQNRKASLPGTMSAKQDGTRTGLVIDSQFLFSTDRLPPISKDMRAMENTKSVQYTMAAAHLFQKK